MSQLYIDPVTGQVMRDDDTPLPLTSVPYERPPETIVVSRHWYETVLEELRALRETVQRLSKRGIDSY